MGYPPFPIAIPNGLAHLYYVHTYVREQFSPCVFILRTVSEKPQGQETTCNEAFPRAWREMRQGCIPRIPTHTITVGRCIMECLQGAAQANLLVCMYARPRAGDIIANSDITAREEVQNENGPGLRFDGATGRVTGARRRACNVV